MKLASIASVYEASISASAAGMCFLIVAASMTVKLLQILADRRSLSLQAQRYR